MTIILHFFRFLCFSTFRLSQITAEGRDMTLDEAVEYALQEG